MRGEGCRDERMKGGIWVVDGWMVSDVCGFSVKACIQTREKGVRKEKNEGRDDSGELQHLKQMGCV